MSAGGVIRGMSVTPHIVVRDAAAASEWYQRGLGGTAVVLHLVLGG